MQMMKDLLQPLKARWGFADCPYYQISRQLHSHKGVSMKKVLTALAVTGFISGSACAQNFGISGSLEMAQIGRAHV